MNMNDPVTHEDLRREVDRLNQLLRDVDVTGLAGFTPGNTSQFLRADGAFAQAGLTQAQILARMSLRV